MEACVREALGLALWDGARYDVSRLPASADPQLVRFFDSGASDGADSAKAALACATEREQANEAEPTDASATTSDFCATRVS